MSKHNRDRRLFRAAGWSAGDRIFGSYGCASELQDFLCDAQLAGARHILLWSKDLGSTFFAVCDAPFCGACVIDHAELGRDILRRAARGELGPPFVFFPF